MANISEFVGCTYRFSPLFHGAAFNFNGPAAFGADQMMMVIFPAKSVHGFTIAAMEYIDFVLFNQALERAVHSGQAYCGSAPVHQVVDLLGAGKTADIPEGDFDLTDRFTRQERQPTT
jgi:hypothetical protein